LKQEDDIKVFVMATMGVGAAMLSACAALEQAPSPSDTVTRLYNEMKVAPRTAAPTVDDRDARIAALESELQQLADALAAGRQREQQLTTEATALQDELARARNQAGSIDVQSARLSDLDRQLLERDQELARLRGSSDELAKAKLQLASMSGTMSERDQEIARLKALLEEEGRSLAQAQRGLVRSLRPEIEKGNIAVDLRSDHLLISLASTMLFGTGQDQLNPAGADALKRVGAVLKDYPEYNVEVAGHTDNRPILGSLQKRFPTNKELSEARAANAVKALTEAGMAATLITSRGYADTKPVAPNTTDAGRSKNRRVEVVVSQK
jgi:chemotaxis protein MotB